MNILVTLISFYWLSALGCNDSHAFIWLFLGFYPYPIYGHFSSRAENKWLNYCSFFYFLSSNVVFNYYADVSWWTRVIMLLVMTPNITVSFCANYNFLLTCFSSLKNVHTRFTHICARLRRMCFRLIGVTFIPTIYGFCQVGDWEFTFSLIMFSHYKEFCTASALFLFFAHLP